MFLQGLNNSAFGLLTNTNCSNFSTVDLRNASNSVVNSYIHIVSNLTYNPNTLQLFWISMFCVLIFGLITNSLFVLTVVKTPSLHSTTYALLTCTACSDCIILLTRLEATARILFHYTTTNAATIAIGCLNFLCALLSTGFIILASVERFLAICHPLMHHRLRGVKRTQKLIATVFLMSATTIGSYIPVFYSTTMVTLICIMWPRGDKFYTYPYQILIPNPYAWLKVYEKVFSLSISVMFFITLASVSYMYAKILITIRKRQCNTDLPMSLEFKKHIEQVSVMVIVNGAVYLFLMSISYTYPISRLLIDDPITLRYWQFVTFAAYDINASINPLIYFLTNERYRCAVKTMFRRCFGKATSLQNTQSDSDTAGEHQL